MNAMLCSSTVLFGSAATALRTSISIPGRGVVEV
jgi:hypothetical protein